MAYRVLWDGFGNIGDVPSINCALSNPNDITVEDARDCVYIYACEQDDIGSPFIQRLHALGGRYLPVWLHQPGMFQRLDVTARLTLEVEYQHQLAGGFAKFDHGAGDFLGLFQALSITRDLLGAYVEIGCFRGSSGGAVLRYLRATRAVRKCFFLDVFSGFDYEVAHESADAHWDNTHATEGVRVVGDRLRSYAGEGVTVSVCVNNCITDDLPEGTEEVAVANIDVDLHEAVLGALRRLSPRIVKGGIIVVEDPGHTPGLIGARAALDIFLSDGGKRDFVPISMDSGQTFLIRR